jgi:hypothetical protein
MIVQAPHKDKLTAAISNPKCKKEDQALLQTALKAYEGWIDQVQKVKTKGKEKVQELCSLLNKYKDILEVELIAGKGSDFIKRQKGQLKLDNSVIEEFLIQLIDKNILSGLPDFELEVGPQTAFMSLSFMPSNIAALNAKPNVIIKEKNQDFTVGKTIYYKFSPSPSFNNSTTSKGKLMLAVLASECKINLDKTMFQESAGTATRLKQGCPLSRYYVLVEYLDMQPEDCRLTAIDNVFLLRHAKRLPFEKRNVFEEVEKQHKQNPIDHEVVWKFVEEIQHFINTMWYDPKQAIDRGSFV